MDDISSSVHSTHPQRFSLENVNFSFSQQTFSPPPPQQRVYEDTNVRSNGSLHPQQFSRGTQTLPPSQQARVNEGTSDSFGRNINPASLPYQQQFSQNLPPSQQLRVNDGADDIIPSVYSTHLQRFSQENVNSSFSQQTPPQPRVNEDAKVRFNSTPHSQQGTQTLAPSQQTRVNGGTSDNGNVRPASPLYEQQFSQTFPPPQQLRVSEGGDYISSSVHLIHRQRFSQENVNSSFSQQTLPRQTLPSSQQRLRVNEGLVDANTRSGSPHPQRFPQENIHSSFSQQKLPPSQQLRVNEAAVSPNARSGSPHPQFSQEPPSSSFSQKLPTQIRANEGAAVDNFGPTVPPTVHRPVSPLFSKRLPSQKIRANEAAAVENFVPNVRPTAHLQKGTVSPLLSQKLPPTQQPRVNEDDFGANVRSNDPPHSQQFSQGTASSSFSQTLPPSQQIRANEGAAVDNSGSNLRSTSPADSSSTAGGRIATFQVQTRPAGSTGGYSLQDSGGRPPKADSSFSASVANTLHDKFDDLKSETKMSPWVTNQFNDILESPIIAEETTRRSIQPANAGSGRSDSPLPVTARSRHKKGPSGLVNQWTNTLQEGFPKSSIRSKLSSQLSEYHDALMEPECEDLKNGETLPKTAVPYSSTRSSLSSVYHDALAAPVCENGETLPKDTVPRSSIRSSPSSHLSVYHDALMEPICEESKNGETPPKTAVPFSVPPATTMTTTNALSAQNTNEESRLSVRFVVEDVDWETGKRVSQEKEQRAIGIYPIFH